MTSHPPRLPRGAFRKGDSKKEAVETFYLDLFGNGGNSRLVDGLGIGTIVNGD